MPFRPDMYRKYYKRKGVSAKAINNEQFMQQFMSG